MYVKDHIDRTIFETEGKDGKTEIYLHKDDPSVDNLIKLKSGKASQIEGVYDNAGNVIPEKIIDVEKKSTDDPADRQKLTKFNQAIIDEAKR
jgi:hypothetical protein